MAHDLMIGRFAPSPTGSLHVGNLRTALIAWLAAESTGSDLRLRIDDLDPATASVEHERAQLRDLAALGIEFDGDVLRQSTRSAAYRKAIDELRERGLLYTCYCSRREVREAAAAPHEHLPEGAYPGTCRDLDAGARQRRERERPGALRVRAELAEIEFHDGVHGPTRVMVDDFVVQRNDGVPAYNLATVVDDAHQGIEQVVRADDLLDGTGRQLWLIERLGLSRLAHAHVPLIVNDEGRRLAKRDGAVTLGELADLGWSPERVRTMLAASLGLCPPGLHVDIEDLAKGFSLDRIAPTPTVWVDPSDRSDS
ncbi:MAG: tRNA glutamyl-Q(34) synthetase GluQRS [Acidimicrobiales bacterium]